MCVCVMSSLNKYNTFSLSTPNFLPFIAFFKVNPPKYTRKIHV